MPVEATARLVSDFPGNTPKSTVVLPDAPMV